MFQGGSFQYPTMEETLPPDEFKKWEVSALPAMQAGPGGHRAPAAGPSAH